MTDVHTPKSEPEAVQDEATRSFGTHPDVADGGTGGNGQPQPNAGWLRWGRR